MSKEKYYLLGSLACLFSVFLFIFNEQQVYWFWRDKQVVPVILGLAAIFLGWMYGIEKRKAQSVK
jgi:hypothetical protein